MDDDSVGSQVPGSSGTPVTPASGPAYIEDWSHSDNTDSHLPCSYSTCPISIPSSYTHNDSWLGNYYLPTNSSLIHTGGVTADLIALNHFTTQTNQVEDGGTTVDSASNRGRLAALRQSLAALPAPQAVAAIRRFLDSQTNAVTGLSVKLNGHGGRDEAPSLRTLLEFR